MNTESTPGALGSNEGLGGRVRAWWTAKPHTRNAQLMTAVAIITLAGGNFLAAWFAFGATWFAWQLASLLRPLDGEEIETLRRIDDCGEAAPEFERIVRLTEQAHGM